jgi:hypothetical protein
MIYITTSYYELLKVIDRSSPMLTIAKRVRRGFASFLEK